MFQNEKNSVRINEKRVLRKRGKLGADNTAKCPSDTGR